MLRAKIDMASPNMKMRDPLLYRIRHLEHYRAGRAWCIYPFYDFTHCLSDALENITHSICTLEFENNRELYDWVIDNVSAPSRPRQYEFARLNLNYTVISKRRLLELVESGRVSGWDDPRMPTISGLRRRGVTPQAIRAFCERIGVSKHNSTVDMALLEHAIRDDLNTLAPRVLCVLRPLKVVIENFAGSATQELEAPYWPHDVPKEGSRKLAFSRTLYIERDDFMQNPPKDFFRLAPGREVRLRHAYIIRCNEVVTDEVGEPIELRCSYDPETRGDAGHSGGRKVKGTIHWVSAEHSVPVEVRLYDRLFKSESPGSDGTSVFDDINPDSLVVLQGRAERSLLAAKAGERFQFERHGFFFVDPTDSSESKAGLQPDRRAEGHLGKAREQDGARLRVALPPRRGKNRKRSPLRRSRSSTRRRSRFAIGTGYPPSKRKFSLPTPSSRRSSRTCSSGAPAPKAAASWLVNELRGALAGKELSGASVRLRIARRARDARGRRHHHGSGRQGSAARDARDAVGRPPESSKPRGSVRSRMPARLLRSSSAYSRTTPTRSGATERETRTCSALS